MTLWGKQFLFIITLAFSAQCLSADVVYVKSLYSLPSTLDPVKMNDTASLAVGNLIYDGLLKFSPSLKIEGALAESWSTSIDGKVLTFKLRDKIYFHSGKPITAADVEASLKRALSSESKVRKYYDSIQSLRTVDKKTFEIVLNYPFPPFLSVLAGATAKVLPKSSLSDPKFFENPIGSGAFKLVSIQKKKANEIHLEAFSKYYQGIPKIEKMILKVSSEAEAIKLAKAGKIHDLANWPLTEDNSIFTQGQRISAPVAATWIIGLNTEKAPFNEIKIRQLFKNNVPAEDFRKTFYPEAHKAHGYVPYGLPGSQVKVEVDVKSFKPSNKKIVLFIPQELARGEEMKKMLEQSLRSQGWNFDVRLMSWTELMEGYSKKTLQAFLVSMNMDYPDADFLLKNFESDNSDNFSGLKNPKIDEILKKSRATRDRRTRDEYYKEALKLVEESAVTVNLFYPRANHWISKCVQNFSPNILSDVYIDYTKITLSSYCQSEKVVQQ